MRIRLEFSEPFSQNRVCCHSWGKQVWEIGNGAFTLGIPSGNLLPWEKEHMGIGCLPAAISPAAIKHSFIGQYGKNGPKKDGALSRNKGDEEGSRQAK